MGRADRRHRQARHVGSASGGHGEARSGERSEAHERSWEDVQQWALESAQRAGRARPRSFVDPKFFAGLAVALAVLGGGIHMASSMSPSQERVEVAQEMPGASATPSGKAVPAAPRAAGPDAMPSARGTAQESEAGGKVLVHVVGAVHTPGVVELEAGARGTDALAAAGGPVPDADVSQVNLARRVDDGEQLYIPKKGEAPPPGASARGDEGGAKPPGKQTGKQSGGGKGEAININSASQEELEELPGVGPSIAERIVEHRDANGPFASVDDLQDVKGIGPATLEKIREKAAV